MGTFGYVKYLNPKHPSLFIAYKHKFIQNFTYKKMVVSYLDLNRTIL